MAASSSSTTTTKEPLLCDKEAGPEEAAERPSLAWPIFACWAYYASASLCTPALPVFCNTFANGDGSARVSQAGIDLKGTFESVDQLLTFFFDPIWGTVSDKVGRKPLQVLACIGIAVGWSTVALSSPLWLLLCGRALDGVTSCMLPICQTAVKDTSDPASLSDRLGTLQGVSLGAAFLLGGSLGGTLTEKASPRAVFATAAVCHLEVGVDASGQGG